MVRGAQLRDVRYALTKRYVVTSAVSSSRRGEATGA
jgi:hypothetical protein